MKSEFGKGLVVNLVKFTEHFGNSQMGRIRNVMFYQEQTIEKREKMISDNPPPNCNYGRDVKENIKSFLECECKIWGNFEKGLSSMITTWANGATDHLYDIKAPKGKEWNEVRKLVKELQNKGLDVGHGFIEGAVYKHEDVTELWELTKKICILVDEKIGLKPDWGQW